MLAELLQLVETALIEQRSGEINKEILEERLS
jgi:hypothetical protein